MVTLCTLFAMLPQVVLHGLSGRWTLVSVVLDVIVGTKSSVNQQGKPHKNTVIIQPSRIEEPYIETLIPSIAEAKLMASYM